MPPFQRRLFSFMADFFSLFEIFCLWVIATFFAADCPQHLSLSRLYKSRACFYAGFALGLVPHSDPAKKRRESSCHQSKLLLTRPRCFIFAKQNDGAVLIFTLGSR